MGQSTMRGWSSDGDYQTPMDSVGETVRSLGAEELIMFRSHTQNSDPSGLGEASPGYPVFLKFPR